MWMRRQVELEGGHTLQVWRTGRSEGPVALLASGLVGDVDALEPLAAELAEDHQVWALAPRGLGGNPETDDHSFEAWLSDLDALRRHAGGHAQVLCGWSSGGRLVVEAAAARPEGCRAVISVSGTWGRPFEQRLATLVDPGSSVFATLTQAADAVVPGLRLPTWAVDMARTSAATLLLRAFGAAAPTTDATRLSELVARSLGEDLHALLASWRGVSRRCRQAAPEGLSVPSLWLAGDHDLLTPVDAVERAAGEASLVVVPGGSHFLPLEQPELIRLHVRRFLTGLPA